MRVSPTYNSGWKNREAFEGVVRPPRVWQEQEEAVIPRSEETTRGDGIPRTHQPGHSVGSMHGKYLPEGERLPSRHWNSGRDASGNAMKIRGKKGGKYCYHLLTSILLPIRSPYQEPCQGWRRLGNRSQNQ